MEVDTLSRSVEKLGGLICAAAAVLLTRRLEGVFFGLMAGAAFGAFIGWRFVPRLIGWPTYITLRRGLWLLKIAAPVGAGMLVIQGYVQLPPVILSWFVDYAQVGYYSAANAVIAPFMLLPVAVGMALLPALAQSTSQAERQGRNQHLRFMLGALIVGGCLSVVVSAAAPFLVNFLFGPGFEPAHPIVPLLALMLPLVFINTYLTNFLIVRDRQQWMLAAALINGAMTALGCVVFITVMGIRGAAVGTLFGEICATAFMIWQAGRVLMHPLER
jgi:O-antigen/teichoic acid export membrane protein